MREVAIVGAVRTPIGKYGGVFADWSAVKLGSAVIREAVRRSGVNPPEVDKVYMGNVIQAGSGQNPARQAMLAAGLPEEVPAVTINCVCGSGLEAINLAAREILLGESEIIVAGGMENMSMAPYVLDKARFGYRMNDGKLKDAMINDALWDSMNDYHMGITAENVAERYSISREAQDQFAAESQQKCEAARAAGRFIDEILPIRIPTRKGELIIAEDEAPRSGVTADGIAKLKPVFLKDGTVTAANASGINDGAAAVVLMSVERAKKLGVDYVTYVTGAEAGTDPQIMGIGAAFAALKALEKSGLSVKDLKLIEANEAFASQSIACAQIAGWADEENRAKVNVNGGAIALGHPVGASGCRILVTLFHELKRRGDGYGLACLCVGGGMGVSAIIKNM